MNPANASILTAAQMRAVDSATIHDEPIASIDLMERAALACVDWLLAHMPSNTRYHIFCGLGNNGGDGLAITRLLRARGQTACAYLIDHSTGDALMSAMSSDAANNWQRLQTLANQQNASTEHIIECMIERIQHIAELPEPCAFTERDCLIDALLGTGTTHAAEGLLAQVIERLNAHTAAALIAIDLPSGLLSDAHTPADWPVIHATHTVTFECAKPALLWPENAERVGDWQILPIGLSQQAITAQHSMMQWVTSEWAQAQRTARGKFAHKGIFGHALLIAGAHGTIGAAILAARACLRSGVGLLTVHSPNCGYTSLQTAAPEAMVHTDANERVWSEAVHAVSYDAIGIGCGIGQSAETRHALRALLHSLAQQPKPPKPLVLDADALNIMASEPDLLALLPPNSILTPHPKEFERLVAHLHWDTSTNALRQQAQLMFAQRYGVIIVLKGAHTCTALPDGRSFYNTTGNPGMAKGGSGDALTGVILAHLAQGYAPDVAAILSVYLHGAAGDRAAELFGQTAMLPSDLIACLR